MRRSSPVFTESGTKQLLDTEFDYFIENYGTPVKQFGQWVVTDCGMVCPGASYYIGRDELAWPDLYQHLAYKNWVNTSELLKALAFARKYHHI